MTFAGFFVNLEAIPPVLRWLQWFAPLKYCLEALAVNEVGSGLMIEDTLQGVPVSVSAALIMNLVSFLLLDCCAAPLTLALALRVRSKQLLSGRFSSLCVYCWLRCGGYWCCLAVCEGEEVNLFPQSCLFTSRLSLFPRRIDARLVGLHTDSLHYPLLLYHSFYYDGCRMI